MSSLTLTTKVGERITFHSSSEFSQYAAKNKSREISPRVPIHKQLEREKYEMVWENAVKTGKVESPDGWVLERV